MAKKRCSVCPSCVCIVTTTVCRMVAVYLRRSTSGSAANCPATAVVTAAAVALAVSSQRRGDAIPQAGEPLFPGLIDRINDVRVITGTSEMRCCADQEWKTWARSAR